jgi:hypothetical protein
MATAGRENIRSSPFTYTAGRGGIELGEERGIGRLDPEHRTRADTGCGFQFARGAILREDADRAVAPARQFL